VVSLAAALSIPLLISEGQAFPYRNLILFITFIVILVTLVLQGLTLPWLIRKLNLEDNNNLIPLQQQEIIIQKKIAHHSLQYLEEKYGADGVENEHFTNLQTRLQTKLNFFNRALDVTDNTEDNTLKDYQDIYLELLEEQRKLLDKINQHAEYDEELIRKHLVLIDMEEFKIREKQLH